MVDAGRERVRKATLARYDHGRLTIWPNLTGLDSRITGLMRVGRKASDNKEMDSASQRFSGG